jgi:hypothetical protein
MISGGSWVSNKKEKGNNNVCARFRLKSQVPTKDIINRILFEFICLGGSKINKKPMQAMETETPMMLLFVCNGTDQASLATDIRLILELAYKDIETDGMIPEEYENQDIPAFSTRLNFPQKGMFPFFVNGTALGLSFNVERCLMCSFNTPICKIC